MVTASMAHTFADSLFGASTIDAEHLPHESQEAAQNWGSVLCAISCQKLGTRTYSAEAAVDDVLAWNIAYTGRHDRDAHASGHQTEGGLYLHCALRDRGSKASLLAQTNNKFRPTRPGMVRIKNERFPCQRRQTQYRNLSKGMGTGQGNEQSLPETVRNTNPSALAGSRRNPRSIRFSAKASN